MLVSDAGFAVTVPVGAFTTSSSCVAKNASNDELDDSKGKSCNDETDETVEDSLFGFLNFARVARGSHVVDAADDHNDDTGETEDGDDGRENGLDVSN